jgi:cytosine/adenosine deaminase-related metal-dependent hydrolase
LQLLLNAKVWTGEKDGTEVIDADILLDKGIIKGIGHVARQLASQFTEDLVTIDVNCSCVTPGIVDMHSHLGDYSSPELEGSSDGNSVKAPVVPWMRALDAINTHDDSYELSISGGVTTSLILPGSADAIGEFSNVIKLGFFNAIIQADRVSLLNCARPWRNHLPPCYWNPLPPSIAPSTIITPLYTGDT